MYRKCSGTGEEAFMKAFRAVGIAAISAALLAAAVPTVARAGAGDTATSARVLLPPPDAPLRALAARHHLGVGTAVNTDALGTDATYTGLVAEQFNTVTPENVMKWQLVEPTQGTYDWSAADRLVAFARAHGQRVRGHTLVWHSQLPTWLTSGTFTPDQLRALLHKHITDEATHFKGQIWQWDVVNEAFNDDGTLRNTIWLQNLGPGYIADAFRWAHQADPHALLFYNDFNIEGGNPKSDAVYALVRQLRAQGVPIDGVGIQGHLGVQFSLPGGVPENMARFAALHLAVAVTEADVRMPMPPDGTKVAAQNAGYSTLLQACLFTSRCISFTVWGFSDKYQWVPGVFTGQGSAALYDENFVPKPAYRQVQLDLALALPVRHQP
jgi:endo-1,4-beta-xylanase